MFTLPRNAQLWLPDYVRRRLTASRPSSSCTVDVMFCIADHFEPDHGQASASVQMRRVQRWHRDYPKLDAFRDADGFPPQHTFFSPLEAYRPDVVQAIADLCSAGFGEVEVHLHHAHDTSANLRTRLHWFRDELASRHRLLGRIGPDPVYAFVHGNWALDNGRGDDAFCGVNDELTVLRESGCFADFTMPAAPDCAQSRLVNRIYYAVDDPSRPRSYDRGTDVTVRGDAPDGGLMMIQGPLRLEWTDRIRGLCPRLDAGTVDARARNRLTLDRFKKWVEVGVSVQGRPEWVFVKVHSHGAKESNAPVLLGEEAWAFHEQIGRAFNDGKRYRLHYVTARQMYNIAKAAEAGESGNAGVFRDYCVGPPAIHLSRDTGGRRATA